jgi:hypothetical protein
MNREMSILIEKKQEITKTNKTKIIAFDKFIFLFIQEKIRIN